MRLGAGPFLVRHGHGERQVGACVVQRRVQALGQVGGRKGESQGAVSSNSVVAAAHAGFQAGQRPGEAGQVVRPHRHAEGGVGVQVLVGVDRHACHLRREAFEHVRHHGLAAEGLQALVDLAHARAASAGEDQPADRCSCCVIVLSADVGHFDFACAALDAVVLMVRVRNSGRCAPATDRRWRR
jgi:hypothetical protein